MKLMNKNASSIIFDTRMHYLYFCCTKGLRLVVSCLL